MICVGRSGLQRQESNLIPSRMLVNRQAEPTFMLFEFDYVRQVIEWKIRLQGKKISPNRRI